MVEIAKNINCVLIKNAKFKWFKTPNFWKIAQIECRKICEPQNRAIVSWKFHVIRYLKTQSSIETLDFLKRQAKTQIKSHFPYLVKHYILCLISWTTQFLKAIFIFLGDLKNFTLVQYEVQWNLDLTKWLGTGLIC